MAAARQPPLALQQCTGSHNWQSSGNKHPRGNQEGGAVDGAGAFQKTMGRSQVLQPSLMSSHYPVNTDMHVVSDQLGRHKGKSWSSAGGSESLHLSCCLFVSVLFVESGSEPGEKKWGGGERGGGSNFILAKDVKQSPRRRAKGLLWTFGLVFFLCLQQTLTLKPGWRLDCSCPVQEGSVLLTCRN